MINSPKLQLNLLCGPPRCPTWIIDPSKIKNTRTVQLDQQNQQVMFWHRTEPGALTRGGAGGGTYTSQVSEACENRPALTYTIGGTLTKDYYWPYFPNDMYNWGLFHVKHIQNNHPSNKIINIYNNILFYNPLWPLKFKLNIYIGLKRIV